MSDWNVVKKLANSGGTRVIEFWAGPDSLFRYHTWQWKKSTEDEQFFHGEGYWANTEMSGYFASLEECETYARQAVIWFQEEQFTITTS